MTSVILSDSREIHDFVLAYDFGGTKIAIATAAADRSILFRDEISTIDCRNGKNALREAILAGQKLVNQTKSFYGGKLNRIGIATMGITRSDRVDMAPNVTGWSELRIEQTFCDAFLGISMRIDNDVKAAALAEVRQGALKDVDVGLYVNLGTGIAIAYILGGQVLHGRHGASGEIAYFMRSKNEERGIRDEVAPLEEWVGGKAIGEHASRHFGTTMTARELFQRARTDDLYRDYAESILQELAFHITNILIAWDPESVVFGGGLIGASDLIFSYLQGYVQKFVPFPPRMELAHFKRDAGLYGAIELALA